MSTRRASIFRRNKAEEPKKKEVSIDMDSLGAAESKSARSKRHRSMQLLKMHNRHKSVDDDLTEEAKAVQEEDKERLRKLHSMTYWFEVVAYVTFLLLLTAIVSTEHNPFMAAQWNEHIRTAFVANELPKDLVPFRKDMLGISTVFDFWAYVQGTLLENLFPANNLQLGDYARDNVLMTYAKVVGVVRMRQVRVKSVACETFPALKGSPTQCYPQWQPQYDLQDTFGVGNMTFKWKSNEENAEYDTWGRIHPLLPGSGFSINFSRNRSITADWLQKAKTSGFVDRHTRAVFLDWTMYNANLQEFAVVRLLFEFLADGGVYPSFNINILPVFRYQYASGQANAVAEGFVLAFFLYFVVRIAFTIHRLRWRFLVDFWGLVELFNLTLFLIVILNRIAFASEVANLKLDIDSETFVSFSPYVQRMDQEVTLLAITIFLFWFLLFRYFETNKRLSLLYRVLGTSSLNLLYHTLIVLIVMYGFASAGSLLFGRNVNHFDNTGDTFWVLLQMMLGDTSGFFELQYESRIMGPLFFFVFIILVFFFLLNMFLAIISDAYNKVKNRDRESKMGAVKRSPEEKLDNIITKVANKLLGKDTSKDEKKNRRKSVMGVADEDSPQKREADRLFLLQEKVNQVSAQVSVMLTMMTMDDDDDPTYDQATVTEMVRQASMVQAHKNAVDNGDDSTSSTSTSGGRSETRTM